MTENDVLNQEQSSDVTSANDVTDDDLFAGYVSEEDDTPTSNEETDQEVVVEDKSEESAEKETNTAPQVASSQEQPFLTIKYNKEDVNLTKDEAIEFSQKGKNYDHVLEKYNALKENEGTFKEIDRLAKANNMSVSDYIKNLSDVQDAFELNKEVEALKEQYPNSDEELLQEVARSHITNKERLVSKKQEDETAARKSEINRQIDVFSRRYADVDPSKLDAKVYSLMKEGYTLLEAYESYQAELRKVEEDKKESLAKIEKQNEENKKKSLGNTSNTGISEEDDFIKELFS